MRGERIPRSAEQWGPVRRGFSVWLGDGRHGSVADIRLDRRGGAELVVATGLFFRTIVAVPTAEIEAIFPGERRIIVGQPGDSCQDPGVDFDPETLEEPVRLPVKRRSSSDSPDDAA